MGVNCPNETKCLHKVYYDGTTVIKNFYAEFKPNLYAQGAFRYCFKGKIKNLYGNNISTSDFPSGECVVKVYINRNYIQEYFIDFYGSLYAHQEALLFNKIINIPNKLNFILPYAGSVNLLAHFKLLGLFKVSTNDDAKKYISPDMKVAIEPYISGDYTKFSSNSGYENQDFTYIPAFSHYTWMHSKGRKVVLDIQGVFKKGEFILTDPACQSLNQEYGNSDLGAMGLCKFVLCHKHNNICEKWKWIPKNFEGLLRAYRGTSIKRTSFSFENRKNIEKYKPIYLKLLSYINFD